MTVSDLPTVMLDVSHPDIRKLDYQRVTTERCHNLRFSEPVIEFQFDIGVTAVLVGESQSWLRVKVAEHLLEYFKGHLEQAGIAYEVLNV